MGPIVVRPLLVSLMILAAAAMPCRDLGAQQPQISDLDRARAHMMLKAAREDLERYYYDTTFAGLNLAQRFDSAGKRIDKATSNSEMFGVIAQILVDLNDSHTWFIPPQRAARVSYGWELLAIGDSVYVQAVRPKTGVERAGLRPGDRLLSVNGFKMTRADVWKLRYLVEALRPTTELRAEVETPGQPPREVLLPADVKVGQARVDLSATADFITYSDIVAEPKDPLREKEMGDVLVWDLDRFSISPDDLGARMRKLDRFKSLVLDLRGNPGGYVVTLQRAISEFLDREIIVSIGRTRTLKGVTTDTVRAQPVRKPYTGRLVVIVDSRSASASELFARIMQLETRATVIGDRTAGSVVMSRFFPHRAGTGRFVPFGFSISVVDVVLANGSRLEGRGMMPDEEMLPTAADLAEGRDPVLARAIAIAGGSIDPVEAGKLFPFRWER